MVREQGRRRAVIPAGASSKDLQEQSLWAQAALPLSSCEAPEKSLHLSEPQPPQLQICSPGPLRAPLAPSVCLSPLAARKVLEALQPLDVPLLRTSRPLPGLGLLAHVPGFHESDISLQGLDSSADFQPRDPGAHPHQPRAPRAGLTHRRGSAFIFRTTLEGSFLSSLAAQALWRRAPAPRLPFPIATAPGADFGLVLTVFELVVEYR